MTRNRSAQASRSILIIASLLLTATLAAAQGRATVDGVVVGPSGAPQANVTLIITNAAGIDRRGVSDQNGQFVFGGLQPGAYRLRTEDETFAPFTQTLTLTGGQTTTVRVALQPRVPVAAPQTARATIQGTVIGPDGRPVGTITVILTNAQGIDRRAVSETNGNYIFGGLQPGTYRLRVDESGAGALPLAAIEVPLAPGESRQLDIRLQPAPVTRQPDVQQPQPPPQQPQTPSERRPRERERARTKEAASPVPEVTAPGGDFQALPNRWNYQWPAFKRYENEPREPWSVGRPFDPYNQNRTKADFPIGGSQSLFANLNLQMNSAINPRQVAKDGSVSQVFNNNNFVGGAELFRGDTVFQPKSWALRGTVVGNINALDGNVGRTYGVEEAFAEKRLAVLSPAFDFVSIRGGMQNFNSDFRGYLFVDNQLGVRLFGNARSNRDQYNVAYFSMRDRDPASQLHRFTNRNQDVVIANYYVQDVGTPGYTAMVNVHLNRDRGTDADPHTLQVTYAGLHGDGKWGSWSVSHAYYEAFGHDDDNRIARVLNDGIAAPVDVSARMAAIEVSRDADWRRYRGSFFYASGDKGQAGKATGFDSITDNPNLAGGQFMFWDQQQTSLTGKAFGAILSDKFSLLPNLRNKFTDRSNFANPGLVLVNGGVDLRLSPQLKVVTNASYLRLADPTILQRILDSQRLPGFEDPTIGWDIGAGAKFRPMVNENLFVVLGFSMLSPGDGLSSALGSKARLYSAVATIQLAY